MNALGIHINHARKAFIPYLLAGYPNRAAFVSLVRTLRDCGADLIEIGIPFSDPLADGPTIQHASECALSDGVTIDRTLELIAECGNVSTVPFVVMSYINPLLQYGIDRFLLKVFQVGVRGLIVPDVIVEEGTRIEDTCSHNGIDLVYLLAPTSPPVRRELVLSRTRGFVYLVSVAGVTGARRELSGRLHAWIDTVKRSSPVPVAVGFGISNADQASSVARAADGVVIGSALIDIIRKASSDREAVRSVAAFARTIRTALDAHTNTEPSPLSSRNV